MNPWEVERADYYKNSLIRIAPARRPCLRAADISIVSTAHDPAQAEVVVRRWNGHEWGEPTRFNFISDDDH